MALPQRVNCRVLNLSDGSKQLVFTLDGADKCVGEIIVRGDPAYLRTMMHMFVQWVESERPVVKAIRNILNGQRAGH